MKEKTATTVIVTLVLIVFSIILLSLSGCKKEDPQPVQSTPNSSPSGFAISYKVICSAPPIQRIWTQDNKGYLDTALTTNSYIDFTMVSGATDMNARVETSDSVEVQLWVNGVMVKRDKELSSAYVIYLLK